MAQQYNRTHISGAATTTIPASLLHLITVNTVGTLATVSDSQGTVAVITTTALGSLSYDVEVGAAFQVVTTGAGTDLTVAWL